MTDTRLKTIGIIKDYMDKTLVEWCLIKLIWNIDWEESYIGTLSKGYESKEALIKDYSRTSFTVTDVEIIWHYDITAVVKYINTNADIDKTRTCIGDWSIIYTRSDWNSGFSLLTKPLHLYTEEEEKDLLKLLISLKKILN